MTFRRRLTIASATAVGIAVAAASLVIYVAERGDLHTELDETLSARAADVIKALEVDPSGSIPAPAFGAPGGYVQVISASGEITHFGARPFLPVSPNARLVAASEAENLFEDLFARGTHVRVLTTSFGEGQAVQVARPLDELDEALRNLGTLLLLVTLGGLLVGGALGSIAATAALAPVGRLTRETERVSATHNLGARIEAFGNDELGRLARSFNTMLSALDSSIRAQRQLVADASHELRTPLTSLNTNFEILARGDLPRSERAGVIEDTRRELENLAMLVRDIIDLARVEGESELGLEDVAVDNVVRETVAVASRRYPHADLDVTVEPCLVRGDRVQIAQAIGNLVENAVKWNGGRPVEISIRSRTLVVRDYGPGIDPEHLPYIFDRFYRAPSARGTPGSGLGLAIVQKVSEHHGWTLTAENADGGGTVFRIDFPEQFVSDV